VKGKKVSRRFVAKLNLPYLLRAFQRLLIVIVEDSQGRNPWPASV
jgi:hypothetical protein